MHKIKEYSGWKSNRKLAVRGVGGNELKTWAQKPFTMKHTEEQEHPMRRASLG